MAHQVLNPGWRATGPRRAWGGGLLVVGLALLLRLPFLSHYACHWDSAEFALALGDYNVAKGQPHPPGFFLYIFFGRLVHLVVSDPVACLVWVSVIFGAGLVAALYALGRWMFDERTGLVAALFALTSPLLWFHSCVGLMYIVVGCLVCVVVAVCWRAIDRGGTWRDAAWLGALLAAVAGVRQQTLPGLVPLAAYTLWTFPRPRWRCVAAAVTALALVGLGWLVPMIWSSGGWAEYRGVVERFAALVADKTLARSGLEALTWNMFFAGAYCWNSLGLAVAPLTAALVARPWRLERIGWVPWDERQQRAWLVLGLWIVPMLFLGTVVAYTEMPGHVLDYVPGLILLAAASATRWRQRWLRLALVTLVVATNTVAFVAWPPAWDGVFFGVGRSARVIREHDDQLGRVIQVVRMQYRPGDVALAHVGEHLLFGLRLFQVHLPEFDHYELRVDPVLARDKRRPLIRSRAGQLEFVSGLDLAGRKTILLLVPPGSQPGIFAPYVDLSAAQVVAETGGMLYAVPAAALRAGAVRSD